MPPFTRTNFAHDETIQFDSGRGKVGFFKPGAAYAGMQETPYDNKWSDGTVSFIIPISHYHLLQVETFYVAQGSGEWTMNGKKCRLSKGDSITIPARTPHRFESIPNAAQDPLIVWHRYDAQRWEMEERFFRNTLCYMWDCKQAGIEASVLQLCIFATDAWIAAEILRCPGPVFVGCFINSILTWLTALLGLLVGYKRSYLEYYDPVWSAQKARERKDQ